MRTEQQRGEAGMLTELTEEVHGRRRRKENMQMIGDSDRSERYTDRMDDGIKLTGKHNYAENENDDENRKSREKCEGKGDKWERGESERERQTQKYSPRRTESLLDDKNDTIGSRENREQLLLLQRLRKEAV